MKKVIPNNETIRHLCHLFGATEYYLLMQDHEPACVVVADIPEHIEAALSRELCTWCGIEIQALSSLNESNTLVFQAREFGTPLHNSALRINLAEE